MYVVADIKSVFSLHIQNNTNLNITHWRRLLLQLKRLENDSIEQLLAKDGHGASAEFAELQQPPAMHLLVEGQAEAGSRLPQAPSKAMPPAAAPATRSRLNSKVNQLCTAERGHLLKM